MKKILFSATCPPWALDFGLFLLRVVAGGFLLVGHGVDKADQWNTLKEVFPDPLGVGNSTSLLLAIFGEVVCAGLLILGLGSRLACVALMVTMGVAAFVQHADDPLFMAGGAAKEPALLYLLPFTVLLFTGPGKWSADHAISNPGKD